MVNINISTKNYYDKAMMMSDKFPLLQQLEKFKKNPESVSPLPKGIKYEQLSLIVENNEINVFIPLREVAAFEQTISEHGKYINRHDFGTILRKHRGIRNWE